MKRVINVGIGGRSFCIEEDAYERMNQYLRNFKEVLTKTGDTSDEAQANEIMSDIETRIAELLAARMQNPAMSVSLKCINEVTSQLGMPDGSPEPSRQTSGQGNGNYANEDRTEERERSYYEERRGIQEPAGRKLFRDPDDHVIGGVCSGLGHYFGCDKAVFRILMVLAVLPFGFLARFVILIGGSLIVPILYLIMCIVIPKASTPAEKCLMRGIPPTAENMRKFY